MIKSFRGQLADITITRIRLSTNDGLTGYKINKFQIFPVTPGAVAQQSVVQLYSKAPTAATGTVDFSNPLLLGAAYYQDDANPSYPASLVVVFDNVTFNQDIFVTHLDDAVGESCNYYLELEQVRLDLNEATVATLKDMRGTN